MSDIAIRLDGLLLLAVVALTGLIFAGVSLVGLLTRRGRLAKGAVALVGISLAVGGGLVLTIDSSLVDSLPFYWIDWMTVPWLLLMAIAAVRLGRASRFSA